MITDEKILELITKLDDLAVNFDNYEFGLPVHSERENLIGIIRNWLEENELKENKSIVKIDRCRKYDCIGFNQNIRDNCAGFGICFSECKGKTFYIPTIKTRKKKTC